MKQVTTTKYLLAKLANAQLKVNFKKKQVAAVLTAKGSIAAAT